MKKSIKITGLVLAVGTVFAAGSAVGAYSDWKTSAVNNAYSDMLDTASDTTDGLVKNVDSDIDNKIQSEIKGTVDDKQAELEKLLEQYYKMKLDGLTETSEFKQLEGQIETIKGSVFEAYKKQIDDAFANKK